MTGRRRLLLLASVTVTFAALAAAYCFSQQNGAESNAFSSALLERMLAFFGIPFEKSGIELSHYLLRKFAHFTVYFVLGCGLSGISYTICGRVNGVLVILLGALCAVADEFHQTLIPERTGGPRDVLIDTLAVACACVLILVCARLQLRKKQYPH